MKKIDLNSPVEFFRGVYPSGKRMNKALLDFYSTDEVYIVRANCASSVEIVMQTDAVTLEVFVKFGKAAREIYTTDVKVNGEFFVLSGAGKHILPLPAGSKQVVVYLPHLAVLDDFYLAYSDVDADSLHFQKEEVSKLKWAGRDEVFQMLSDGRFVDYEASLMEKIFDAI